MKRVKNIKRNSGLAGLYAGLTMMIFMTVGFGAFYVNSGNIAFLVLSVGMLFGFLFMCVKVHNTHYPLREDIMKVTCLQCGEQVTREKRLEHLVIVHNDKDAAKQLEEINKYTGT